MSILHTIDIPRLDSGGAGLITPEDIAKLGPQANTTSSELIRRTKIELRKSPGWDERSDGHTTDAAIGIIGSALGPILGIEAVSHERTDAPADFVTSGLTLELGAGSEIVRGMDEEFLFIPGRAPAPLLGVQDPFGGNRGARKFRYPVRSHTGQAKWTHPVDTRNLEKVGVARDRKEQGAEYYGICYGHTIPQTWEWSALGINGEAELATAANYEMDTFAEYNAGWGEADLEIPGFFALGDSIINLLGTPISELASAQTMLNIIGFIDHQYRKANKGAAPTRLVAPLADQYAMNNTRFGVGGEGDSVMTVARALYPWLNNAMWTDRMDKSNSAGDGPRWQLWRDMPDMLFLGQSANMVFGPFQDRMIMEFVILRRFTGIVSKKPEIVQYNDFDAFTP